MLTKEEKIKYVTKKKKEIKNYLKEVDEESIRQLKQWNHENREIYKRDHKLFPKSKLKIFSIKEARAKSEKIDDKYLNRYYVKPKNVCHDESIYGICITPYLNKIRNRNNKEHELALLIKNNKVIKDYIYTSNKFGYVSAYDFQEEVIKNAKKYKSDVYLVHNHPYLISAKPSVWDVRSFMNQEKSYKDKGIRLLDIGVVTFDDYYSFNQARKTTKKIMKIVQNDGIKHEFVKDLIEITFLSRTKRIMYKPKKYHPIYLTDSSKKERVKRTPIKKYMKLKKQARNEVNKIIKEHPEYAF